MQRPPYPGSSGHYQSNSHSASSSSQHPDNAGRGYPEPSSSTDPPAQWAQAAYNSQDGYNAVPQPGYPSTHPPPGTRNSSTTPQAYRQSYHSVPSQLQSPAYPLQIQASYSTPPAQQQPPGYRRASTNYPAQQPAFFPTPSQIYQSQHNPRPSSGDTRAASLEPSSSPTAVQSQLPPERYACDRCGKTFSRSYDRKRHYETHAPVTGSNKCQWCRKDFSRPDSLKRHMDNGCDDMPPQ